jgi:hypothetical protein
VEKQHNIAFIISYHIIKAIEPQRRVKHYIMKFVEPPGHVDHNIEEREDGAGVLGQQVAQVHHGEHHGEAPDLRVCVCVCVCVCV